MRSPSLFAALLLLAAMSALPSPEPARAELPAVGGTRADYERAAKLPGLVRDKVIGGEVRPRWLPGDADERFWYRRDLGGGRTEFVLVDPARSEKRPAFDHARLAAALAKALGRQVTLDRLPVEGLEFPPGGDTVRLSIEGRAFAFGLGDGTLKPDDGTPPGALTPLALADAPARSDTRGGETYVTFVNRGDRPAPLAWRDFDGRPQPFGPLAPRAIRRQHTFAGHVWLIGEGDRQAVFVAGEDSGAAVFDGKAPAQKAAPPPGPDPAVSPDGRWRVVLRDHNALLADAKTGRETPITRDGTAGDAYDRPYWAPDRRHLVLFQTVPEQEHTVYTVESSPRDRVEPRLHREQYLKPGDRVAHPRPRLFAVGEDGAVRQIPVADELFPNPWDLTETRWTPDGARFLFLYNQRGHQLLRLIALDAATGTAKSLIEERSETFIDYSSKTFLSVSPDASEAVWMSERDGWNHLYLYDLRTGAVKKQVTRGEWVVRRADRVDWKTRQVSLRAGGVVPGQDPYYQHYCRAGLDGNNLTVLTDGDGTHEVRRSPGGKSLRDTWTRVDLPPVTEQRRASDGKKLLELERADAAALLATGWRTPERFVAKGRDGKTDIYGVLYRPSNFDPARRYPVVEQIYAGPHGQFVPKAFSAWHGAPQELAELGFVVVQIDGMGTNWRSRAFHDVCWKNLADAGLPDRIAWIRAAAAKYPYLDLSRGVGIYGGSAGGQNALGALLTHGEFYTVGAADCGCHDNRMDKIWWNEQWMGWPVGPEYARSSNVTQAAKLTGKLLLTVGELDTNVDPASTMQVVDALIRADKDFDLLVVPGAGHGVGESPYARRRRLDLFVRHLLGVEPRR